MKNSLWVWREDKIRLPEVMANGKPWPKITVVTPSFNQGHYIEETIRSVVMQGYPNLEYIIIDGGSTDNTIDVITRYAADVTYWVSEEDRGQTHAVNKGLEKATGDIHAYLNSDDVYLPYTLRLVAELFSTFGIQWLTGHRSHLVDETVIAPLPGATVKFNSFLYAKGFHVPWVLGWNQQPSTFWSAGLLDMAGGKFREDMQCSFDVDMWIRFSAHQELVYVRSVLAMMRQHAAQKSRNLRLDYKEIEGSAMRYKFYPLWYRKALMIAMHIPIARTLARILLKNPKAKWVNWDPLKGKWSMIDKNVF